MAKLNTFSFPKNLEEKIWIELKSLNCDPDAISRIAESIIRLSDHFISAKEKSPLSEKWAQIAYLAYYFPMNYLRALSVCTEAKRLGFFENLNSAVDIGSGMGSLTSNLVLAKPDWQKLLSFDVSGSAIEIQRKLLAGSPLSLKILKQDELTFGENFDLACLSYSWNEFSPEEKLKLLSRVEKFEALMFIEPSTSVHARNLMELRAQLIAKGFHAWGPCTHQGDCPLLVNSKTDWCHDRIGVEKSKWFTSIEKLLPFKNETLTFSYLLMRKTPPPFKNQVQNAITYAPSRVIGDELVEKGKTRQAICRSSEREFFAWFPQRLKHNNFGYTHGEFINLNIATPKKSNELRINEEDVIKEKA